MVPREFLNPTLRLGLLLACTALLTSRFVLVFHEFLGHAGAAILAGGELVSHRLFLFGGGWVLTKVPALEPSTSIIVALAGLAVEVLFAIGMIVLARPNKRSLTTTLVATVAAGVTLIHVGVYLCLGTHFGYGDGRALHRVLGEARVVVVIVAGAMAIIAGGWLGARAARAARPLFGGQLGGQSRARTLAALALASAFAGVTHGSLMLAEQAVASDPTYAEVMREDAERLAREAVAREAARRDREGRAMSDAERRARVRVLADEARRAPIRLPLYILIGLSAMVGAWRGARPAERVGTIANAELLRLAIVTAGSISLVAALHAPWWRGVL